MLCFSMFFACFHVSQADVSGVKEKIQDKIVEWFTKVLLGLGDSVLHIIIASVGENVTIDKLVFNEVKKVDIDFWSKGAEGSLKSYMLQYLIPL